MLKLTNSVGWFVSFALDSFASGTPLLNGPLAYANHHHLPTPSRPKGRRAQGNKAMKTLNQKQNDQTNKM